MRMLLDQAAQISKKRNEIIHSMALSQGEGRKFRVRHKGVEKEHDPFAINHLAELISDLFESLMDKSNEFSGMVDAVRKARNNPPRIPDDVF